MRCDRKEPGHLNDDLQVGHAGLHQLPEREMTTRRQAERCAIALRKLARHAWIWFVLEKPEWVQTTEERESTVDIWWDSCEVVVKLEETLDHDQKLRSPNGA